MKRYIVISETGEIKMLKLPPSADNCVWMELKPGKKNAETLARAAEYCDKEVDYEI
jgi:hypothetical protein